MSNKKQDKWKDSAFFHYFKRINQKSLQKQRKQISIKNVKESKRRKHATLHIEVIKLFLVEKNKKINRKKVQSNQG